MTKKNFMQLGRTMMEMLGVLVIVGVLSIVGISGYQKAVTKMRADELMNLAMKVYHEAVARNVMNPITPGTNAGDASKLYLRPYGSTSANLGWERPSWTDASFNIMARPMTKNGHPEAHYIVFYYMKGDAGKEVCAELAQMTEVTDEANFRRLPGSMTDELSSGVLVGCSVAGSVSDTNSLWPK